MHHSKYFLYRKKTICNSAQEKRRNNGAYGTGCISQVNNFCHAMALHIVATRCIPGTPYKKLQEHHQAQTGLSVWEHKQSALLI